MTTPDDPHVPEPLPYAMVSNAEPTLLERQPVAVFLGGLATTVGVVLVALAGLDVIAWDLEQIGLVVGALASVTGLIVLTLRSMVVSPATHDRQLSQVIDASAVTLEVAEVPPVDVDALAERLAPALARQQRNAR